MNTYEFTYRGYTILQNGHVYGVIEDGIPKASTHDLINLIKAIDEKWDGKKEICKCGCEQEIRD